MSAGKPAKATRDYSQPCKFGADCRNHAAGKCMWRHASVVPEGKSMTKVHKAPAMYVDLRHILKQLAPLSTKVSALRQFAAQAALKDSKAPQEKDWTVLTMLDDKKKLQQNELDLAVAQLQAAVTMSRQVLASSYGKKAVPFVIPHSFNINNTSAGVCANVQALDLTSTTEWASLTALFEEYRFVKGVTEFNVSAGAFNPPTTSSCVIWVLGYDPNDATALTSTRNGAELNDHKLYAPSQLWGGAGAGTFSSSGVYLQGAKPMQFKFAPPSQGAPALVTSGSGSNPVSMPGGWKMTSSTGAANYDGWSKVYSENGLGNGVQFIAGIHYLHVLFRYRA